MRAQAADSEKRFVWACLSGSRLPTATTDQRGEQQASQSRVQAAKRRQAFTTDGV